MLTNTSAFKRLKTEQQNVINFAVLLCHAIPTTKKMIIGEEKGVKYFNIPDVDYFNKSPNSRIIQIAQHYKQNTSKYLIISTFSFFEFYIKDVIIELIDFHGGLEQMIKSVLGNFIMH